MHLFITGARTRWALATPKGSYPLSLLSRSFDRKERECISESGRFFLFDVDPIAFYVLNFFSIAVLTLASYYYE